MKRVSIEEAIQLGLLYEGMGGIAIRGTAGIDFSEIEEEDLNKLLEGIDEPSILVDDDGNVVSRNCY